MISSYYYTTLSDPDRCEYDQILNAVRERQPVVRAGSMCNIEVYQEIVNNHPELFYMNPTKILITSSLMHKEMKMFYIYSDAEVKKYQEQLDEVVEYVKRELIDEHQSEYDRVLVLHDYLKTSIEYDRDTAAGRNKAPEAHNIIGGLILHKGVCDSFAKSFKYLCDALGIDCVTITGMGNNELEHGPHAWNAVKINGIWQQIDVTWDNQFMEDKSIPNYCYMNLSDDEMNRDHTWNRRMAPPCPDSPYSYFRMNDCLLDSKVQLERYLKDCLEMEEEQILFKVASSSRLEMEIAGCLQECVFRAASKCRGVSVASFQCTMFPEHKV